MCDWCQNDTLFSILYAIALLFFSQTMLRKPGKSEVIFHFKCKGSLKLRCFEISKKNRKFYF